MISRRNREEEREGYEFFKEGWGRNGGKQTVLCASHQLTPFPKAARFLLRRLTVTKGQGEGRRDELGVAEKAVSMSV